MDDLVVRIPIRSHGTPDAARSLVGESRHAVTLLVPVVLSMRKCVVLSMRKC